MKIIKEPKKNIALLWRSSKLAAGIYRPMYFLIQKRVDDGLLLYNVVTSEMVLLDDYESKLFERLPCAYETKMDELIDHHFIVQEEFDEHKSVRQLRALIKKLEPSKRIDGFTILPTTECNARCYYCFESDYERCTMTEKLASDTVNYIAAKCDSKPIKICWFGGEPLVGRKRISQICSELEQREIKFTSTMVTNSYLFDEELIRLAKNEWKLTNVQVTLDGTEDIYNNTKAYINPQDSPYRRVLHNIEVLLENDISVTIRLNVTSKNTSDLSMLIDELYLKFGGKKGLACYSHAVYEGVGFDPLSYDDGLRDLVDSEVVLLDQKLRDKGLMGSLSQLPNLRVINCMSDNDSCRLIYPDGTIGRCEDRPSTEGVGDIYNDITDREAFSMYASTEAFAACEKCCLYPYCVNLTVCPETGKCSKPKLEWKKSRYADLVKEQYMYMIQNHSLVDEKDTVQIECES